MAPPLLILHSLRSPILLRCPRRLRASALQPSAARSFSASQPLSPPIAVLDSLHGLGLPWYAALPTAAVLVRGVLIYFVCTLPAQKDARVRNHLLPLAAAHSMLHERVQQGPRNDIPFPWLKKFEFEFRRWRVQRRTLERFGQQFKLTSPWKRSMINFFTLISFTEAVRLKCGSSEGLLSVVLSPLEWIRNALIRKPSPPTPVVAPQPKTSHDEDMAQRLELTATTDEAGKVSYDLSTLNATPGAGEPSAYFDPSMQTEGLNWCIDLTASDSTFILPILLWLSVSANIIFQRTASPPKKVAVPTKAKAHDAASQLPELKPDKTFDTGAVSPEALNTLTAPAYGSSNSDKRFLGYLPPVTNLQRIQLCIVLVILAAILKIPAAIFLYWIPSLAVGAVQRRWLAAKFPLRPPIQPCRRPLRFRVKKAWSN
ncbi:hypothetical protein LTR74_016278 [Friedmanniomyces endolithicus]|nr:hypothetical protein LTR74_016278 [Friedmanniomyces endolithicus]